MKNETTYTQLPTIPNKHRQRCYSTSNQNLGADISVMGPLNSIRAQRPATDPWLTPLPSIVGSKK